ncbi:hypothetical protein M3Y99_01839100 [Aphelenchoides fujianensis]|nr:hypothetical protein M3Y99_01839100 [Aphelenchoides fujianensis]
MLQFNFVRIWKFICCASTISEQNELEIAKQEAKAKETQEFHKWNKEYLTCCGLVHIRGLTKGMLFTKTFIFGSFLLSLMSMDGISPLILFGLFLAFGLALTSYAILLIGLQSNRYHYLIPYFFVSFLLIVLAVAHLFVDFLQSADTQDTMSDKRMSSFVMQIGMIGFEVYVLMLVWRCFQYICDARMAAEIEEKRRRKDRLYDEDYL